ncbi:MAG: L,D-transpeptidase [Chthoniobacterales bacterium]|nr:L,D-transpeptidase [Chthoniobacterales bacterium]
MAIKNVTHREAPGRRELVVDVAAQMLRVMDGATVAAEFPVSTSRFGLGFEEGSYHTPTGRFVIRDKIGHGAPAWTVFRSRQNTGEITSPGGSEDLVLSRILTLDGLDPQNSNTMARYVYIHGTNQEDLIGSPASHGCVRLRNSDIITLHDMVSPGTPVSILPPL